MDLWQLKVFVNVVEQKSFSRAGETVFLSQPTVSSHIKELEGYLQCRLIDRLSREAVPTKAGELLYSYAKQLLDIREEAEAAISDFLGSAKGHLTIGGSTIPSGYIIPRHIGMFSKKYPDITLSVKSGDTAEIILAVTQGKIEIGIVGAGTDEPDIFQEKLIEDEMKLILPASHPWAKQKSVDCSDIFKTPFIAREHGSGTWKSISKSISDAGYSAEDLNITARMGNTVSVIQAVLNLAGISILSTMAVEDYIEAGKIKAISVDGLDLHRNFFLITHKKRTLSPLSGIFLSFLKDQFA